MTAAMDPLDHLPPLELDDEWFQILRAEDERLGTQVYGKQSAPAEDNGEDRIVTNQEEQSAQMGGNSSPHTAIEPSLMEYLRDFGEPDEMIIDNHGHGFDGEGELPRDLEEHQEITTDTDGDEFDEEEELLRYYEEMRETYDGEFDIPEGGNGARWPSSQVGDFLQTLSRIDTGTLEPDDLKCAICQSEYGKERGDTSKPASDSDKVLPGQETAEYPVRLPCGHVLGLWCIKTWLLNAQPASCPLCRHQFQPVR